MLVILDDMDRNYYRDVAWFRALFVFLINLMINFSPVYAGLGLQVRW